MYSQLMRKQGAVNCQFQSSSSCVEPSHINKHYYTAAREAEMMASVLRLQTKLANWPNKLAREQSRNKPQTRTFCLATYQSDVSHAHGFDKLNVIRL